MQCCNYDHNHIRLLNLGSCCSMIAPVWDSDQESMVLTNHQAVFYPAHLEAGEYKDNSRGDQIIPYGTPAEIR